ncbi:hypothetical protein BDZ89DRAFT_1045403 [Hymenopellis radicata]|nr:hypothetical protein BDZ89DRAFT_1045403 [Hymenopellis radicata]
MLNTRSRQRVLEVNTINAINARGTTVNVRSTHSMQDQRKEYRCQCGINTVNARSTQGVPPSMRDQHSQCTINARSTAINVGSTQSRQDQHKELDSATDRVNRRISATRSPTRSADRIAFLRSDPYDPDHATDHGQAEGCTDRWCDPYTQILLRSLTIRSYLDRSGSIIDPERSRALTLLLHHHHPSLGSLLALSLAFFASSAPPAPPLTTAAQHHWTRFYIASANQSDFKSFGY